MQALRALGARRFLAQESAQEKKFHFAVLHKEGAGGPHGRKSQRFEYPRRVGIKKQIFSFPWGNAKVIDLQLIAFTMSLVSCPVCSNPIAYDAEACPRCAHKDPSGEKRRSALRGKLFAVVVLVVAGAYLWFVQLPAVFNVQP